MSQQEHAEREQKGQQGPKPEQEQKEKRQQGQKRQKQAGEQGQQERGQKQERRNPEEGRINRQFLDRWQQMDRLYADYAKSKGLTYMSFNVLCVLYDHPEGCTQTQICGETFYAKQSVNLIIKGLWERGYAELRELPHDRRNKLVCLTVPGRAYAYAVLGGSTEAEEAAAGQFTQEEWDSFLEQLDRYNEVFGRRMRQLIREEGRKGAKNT